MSNYRRITYEDRCQIYALSRRGALVEATAWKKFHSLRGKDKELSRQRALMLFPSAHALLARKKDHGKAEAALIGLFGARSYSYQGTSVGAGSASVAAPCAEGQVQAHTRRATEFAEREEPHEGRTTQ
jgi:crossover junction endodeoxyribonuclease RuvC